MQFLRRFLVLGLATLCAGATVASADPPRPNILWITSEDNGPHLGCYGDTYATTPQLDALAAKGLVYRFAWSNAPVCAPARTTIISGLYPPSTGAEHMRSMTRLPEGFAMYPQYLREAGYYCTNNSKEDYNLEKVGQVWDESSPRAHWKNRAKDQPFFAIFNHTVSHESQIRKRPHTPVHDPAKVRVPAYHPDTPEVRRGWAQYYDKLTEMDELAGRNLQELEAAGLADDTIIFYYGDHGSGMPRSKRWPFNSGLHVPLIVYIPEKFAALRTDDYQAGGKSERLVSFVDLAPTVLSLAGIKPPAHMQGHAFLGPHATKPQPYIFGFRGRMDERLDLVRSVRDERYVYVRHYMPHLPYGQHVSYMFETPTTQVWKRLFDAGELNEAQAHFWQPKPAEELFDLTQDPDEVRNLADSPEHREVLERMRAALRKWQLEIRDVGLLPEDEIHVRSAERTPYEVGHDADFPLERILETAELAANRDSDGLRELANRLEDRESAVRYWATLGILMRGESAMKGLSGQLMSRLADQSPSVRVAAAEALALSGTDGVQGTAQRVLLSHADLNQNSLYVTVAALNALDRLSSDLPPTAGEQLKKLPRTSDQLPGRLGDYADRLLTKILADIERRN